MKTLASKIYVCKKLEISRPTVYDWIKKGKINEYFREDIENARKTGLLCIEEVQAYKDRKKAS